MWGCSSLGRALEWHSRGKGFDPPHLHQRPRSKERGLFSFNFMPSLTPPLPSTLSRRLRRKVEEGAAFVFAKLLRFQPILLRDNSLLHIRYDYLIFLIKIDSLVNTI